MTQPTILDRLLCTRCGEMLEDAITITDGRRVCPACVCHSCGNEPYRFRDESNDDQQLCERCVISELTTKAMVTR